MASLAEEHKIVKVDDLKEKEEEEFAYEGRINARMTEEDYSTANLMTVS